MLALEKNFSKDVSKPNFRFMEKCSSQSKPPESTGRRSEKKIIEDHKVKVRNQKDKNHKIKIRKNIRVDEMFRKPRNVFFSRRSGTQRHFLASVAIKKPTVKKDNKLPTNKRPNKSGGTR